ncbi:MAG: restriction endonuclease subunit S [Abyssibacter sp.]|nr:restriction endonuclease subunit S [Abyssibacter sp.]MCK5860516.1 restriction endonuclease subunit S [Abyssibacter sp.]
MNSMESHSKELNGLIHIKHGFAFKSEHFSEQGKYVVLTPANFFEGGGFKITGKERFYTGRFPDEYILSEGALIVAMTEQAEGLLGSPAEIPRPDTFLHNQRLGLVTVQDPVKLDSHYLRWAFRFKWTRDQIRASSNGAKVRHTSPERIYRVRIPLPEKTEQRKIAAILTAYDDLIENNRQRIALLEKMAEEIYREWFVRLRFPGHEHTPVHKGVPEEWEPTTLFDLCRLKRGYDLPKQNVVAGKYPILAATGIPGFHNAYKAKPPVVTTGRSGSLGAVVWSSEPSWPLNTSLYVADSNGNSKHFLFYTLKSANLAQFNSGAGVPTLNRNHLSCVRVLRPPRDIQSRFDKIVSTVRDQTDTLRRSNCLLAETRDLLLNRLISGKLRVDDLDIQFPPSMQDKAA